MPNNTLELNTDVAIERDEKALAKMREEEILLLEAIARGHFSETPKREEILSEIRLIEGRLRSNRRKQSALKREKLA